VRQPPLCRHDHRVKGEAGWQLHRVGDTFEWTTRLGHRYLVPVPPVLPDLPEQRPSPPEDDLPVDPATDSLGRPWQTSTSWCEPESPPGRPHTGDRDPPDPLPPDPDDPLPF
jgi:hypothetical protein